MKTAFVAASVLLALAGPALAEETCYTTTHADVDTGTGPLDGGSRYYVYTAPEEWQPFICGIPCNRELPDTWIYEESNGIDGLQREDSVQSDVRDCTDGTRGDAVIW